MNSWTITINGFGPHHNGQPDDADRIAAEALQKLMTRGHLVTTALFNFGGQSNLFLVPPQTHEPICPTTE